MKLKNFAQIRGNKSCCTFLTYFLSIWRPFYNLKFTWLRRETWDAKRKTFWNWNNFLVTPVLQYVSPFRIVIRPWINLLDLKYDWEKIRALDVSYSSSRTDAERLEISFIFERGEHRTKKDPSSCPSCRDLVSFMYELWDEKKISSWLRSKPVGLRAWFELGTLLLYFSFPKRNWFEQLTFASFDPCIKTFDLGGQTTWSLTRAEQGMKMRSTGWRRNHWRPKSQ